MWAKCWAKWVSCFSPEYNFFSVSLATGLDEKERIMGKNILCAGMKLSLQLSTTGPWAWDHTSHTWEMMR